MKILILAAAGYVLILLYAVGMRLAKRYLPCTKHRKINCEAWAWHSGWLCLHTWKYWPLTLCRWGLVGLGFTCELLVKPFIRPIKKIVG